MTDEAVVSRIAREAEVEFGPASPADVVQMLDLGIPESIVSFYRSFEPSDCAEIDGVRLWPIAEVLRENSDFVPGAHLVRHGLVVFATNVFGDAFCLDLRRSSNGEEPHIALLPHDVDFENADEAFVSRYAKVVAPSFDEFLEQMSTSSVDSEPHYPDVP